MPYDNQGKWRPPTKKERFINNLKKIFGITSYTIYRMPEKPDLHIYKYHMSVDPKDILNSESGKKSLEKANKFAKQLGLTKDTSC